MAQQMLDSKGRPVVVVTGIGIVTSLGFGKEDNWGAVTAGRSGIREITRFPTGTMRTTIAGTVDFLHIDPHTAPALAYRMAELSAIEAIEQAAIGSKTSFPGPLILAVPPAETEWFHRKCLSEVEPDNEQTGYSRMLAAARRGNFREMYEDILFCQVAERLSQRFGTAGQPISLTTACASGATAIQLGVDAIRQSATEAVLCIGTDGSIHEEGLIRFSLLSALSRQNNPPEKAAKPFSKNRDGFVMGEGSATLVLESYDAARARGANILGVIQGCGEKADDFHRTRSNPNGFPIISAIRNALDDAGKNPSDVDYVNAHGTGTNENDKMEYLALETVFGDHLENIPVSSNKSIVGHTLSAAGSIEAAFSLMTLELGVIPPTINYDIPDPDIPLDVVPNVKRDARVSTVLSNSFGFGGQNVCLILSGEPD